jgi:hypothetical protein
MVLRACCAAPTWSGIFLNEASINRKHVVFGLSAATGDPWRVVKNVAAELGAGAAGLHWTDPIGTVSMRNQPSPRGLAR